MKIRVYANVTALEMIARGDGRYLLTYSFDTELIHDTKPIDPTQWHCGDFELTVPSRDQAVMLAQKALRAQQSSANEMYEERIAKLLALTWEAPNA